MYDENQQLFNRIVQNTIMKLTHFENLNHFSKQNKNISIRIISLIYYILSI